MEMTPFRFFILDTGLLLALLAFAGFVVYLWADVVRAIRRAGWRYYPW